MRTTAIPPDFYKTIRGLQAAIELMCLQFIPVVSEPAYVTSEYMPCLTPATCIGGGTAGPDAEYNWQYVIATVATTGRAGWVLPVDGPPPSNLVEGHPVPCNDPAWTPAIQLGSPWAYNAGDDIYYRGSATVFNADGSYASGATQKIASWQLSTSWARSYPREFQYLYGKTGFVPDTKTVGGVTSLVFPSATVDPDAGPYEGAGTWQSPFCHGPSTNYAIIGNHGAISDSYTTAHGGVTTTHTIPFIDGELARYIGDGWQDGRYGLASPGDPTEDNPVIIYQDTIGTTTPATLLPTMPAVKAPALRPGRPRPGERHGWRQIRIGGPKGP